MLTLYIITGIIGLGLIVVSALGGLGSDSDFSSDVDHDLDSSGDVEVSQDVDHPSAADAGDFWLPFFSLRFWIYFMGGFGGFGALLTFANVSAEPVRAISAGIVGLILGVGAAVMMRFLYRNQLDSSISDKDFVGTLARVLVSPVDSNPGKVRVEIRNESIDLLAIPLEGHLIQAGDDVMVVAVDGTYVTVAKTDEYLNS